MSSSLKQEVPALPLELLWMVHKVHVENNCVVFIGQWNCQSTFNSNRELSDIIVFIVTAVLPLSEPLWQIIGT